MADQPDPSSSEENHITGVPGEHLPPEEPTTKADIDRLLGGNPLTAAPLPAAPPVEVDDLRAELGVGSSTPDPRAMVEKAAAPEPLTAEVVEQLEALSPEAAAELVIGPKPDPAKIRPDVTGLHRKTVPAQTVAEATAKAKTTLLPGTDGVAAPPVDPEEAKKILKAEIDRVAARITYGTEITKDLKPELNPLHDPEFQRFVRSHLSHLIGFYVVTGQPVGELRAEVNEKALSEAEKKLMADVDPSLVNHPAAKLALQLGWQPNADETE